MLWDILEMMRHIAALGVSAAIPPEVQHQVPGEIHRFLYFWFRIYIEFCYFNGRKNSFTPFAHN